MIRFLVRSCVYPFYRAYAGLLFAVFLMAAGILRGEEHLAMALFFTGHIKNLVYPVAGMVLYELLTIHFSIRLISDGKSRPIREIIFAEPTPKIKVLLRVLVYLQLPVVIYTVFLLGVALYAMNILTFFAIATSGIIRIILYTMILNHVLVFPREKRFARAFHFRFPTIQGILWITLFFQYFIHEKFLSLILGKIFSLTLLGIAVILIPTVDYYERFAAITFIFVFLGNSFLSYNLFRFQHIGLDIFRNLPFRPLATLLQVSVTILILTLPEIIFMYRNFEQILTPVLISINVLNGIAILIFLYAAQVFFYADPRTYIIRIFWGSLFLVLLFLFDFPAYILAALLFLLAFYFYYRGYYIFETVYDQSIDR